MFSLGGGLGGAGHELGAAQAVDVVGDEHASHSLGGFLFSDCADGLAAMLAHGTGLGEAAAGEAGVGFDGRHGILLSVWTG